MKNFLFILFACISNIVLGQHHHPHHSSHHSSSHTSSHSHHHHVYHGTSHGSSNNHSHPYAHVKRIHSSEIHSYHSTNNTIMYYYLLHNNHTNTNDTIKATSIIELEQAVDEISEEPTEITGGVFTLILVVVGLIILVVVWFNKNLHYS